MTSEYWSFLSYGAILVIFGLFLYLMIRPNPFRSTLSFLPIPAILLASFAFPEFDYEDTPPTIRASEEGQPIKLRPDGDSDVMQLALLEAIDRAELMVMYELEEIKEIPPLWWVPSGGDYSEGQSIATATIINVNNEYVGSALIFLNADVSDLDSDRMLSVKDGLKIQRVEWLPASGLATDKLWQRQLQRARDIIEADPYVATERGGHPEPAAGLGG
jgi:hypothetical protein